MHYRRDEMLVLIPPRDGGVGGEPCLVTPGLSYVEITARKDMTHGLKE